MLKGGAVRVFFFHVQLVHPHIHCKICICAIPALLYSTYRCSTIFIGGVDINLAPNEDFYYSKIIILTRVMHYTVATPAKMIMMMKIIKYTRACGRAHYTNFNG